MTPRDKIDAAVKDLLDRGVPSMRAAPPHYKLLWAMGLFVPPLLFQSFLGNFLLNGMLGGVFFAALAWFAERHHGGIELLLVAGIGGGLVIGLISGGLYRFYAWRLGLPRWADYDPQHDDTYDADW